MPFITNRRRCLETVPPHRPEHWHPYSSNAPPSPRSWPRRRPAKVRQRCRSRRWRPSCSRPSRRCSRWRVRSEALEWRMRRVGGEEGWCAAAHLIMNGYYTFFIHFLYISFHWLLYILIGCFYTYLVYIFYTFLYISFDWLLYIFIHIYLLCGCYMILDRLGLYSFFVDSKKK